MIQAEDSCYFYLEFLKLIVLVFVVQLEREDEFSDRLSLRTNFKGCTALHYAVLANCVESVRALLEADADPTIENDSGHPPMNYCRDEQIRSMLGKYTAEVGIHFTLTVFIVDS